jgi:transposase
MAVVMTGVDPHKASHTAVAVNAAEEPRGQLRVRAPAVQAGRLLGWARAWPERAWAVEGAGGLGHLLARQLLSAGERVPGVPPGLAARVRLLATGDSSKNDPGDARSVAVAAPRPAGVRQVRRDDHAAVLKVWTRALPGPGPDAHPGDRPAAPGAVRADPRRRARGDHRRPGRPAPGLGHAAGAVQAARCELAAELTEDLRGVDARIRGTRTKAAAAVAAAGTSPTGLSGVGPVIAAAVTGDVRPVSRSGNRDRFAACNGTAPIEVSSGGRTGLPAAGTRQPPARPRHPHGRDHPDPLPAHQGPRLLRQETGRGHNRQTGAARAQTPDQRRHLHPPARRRPARRRRRGQKPGRATGEPLCIQGGRLTPRPPALRASHSRACHPPYDPRCSRPRAAAIWCERAAGSRTGPSPAAQRPRRGVLDPAANEPIMPAAGKGEAAPPLTLKQRGVRSARASGQWRSTGAPLRLGDSAVRSTCHGVGAQLDLCDGQTSARLHRSRRDTLPTRAGRAIRPVRPGRTLIQWCAGHRGGCGS